MTRPSMPKTRSSLSFNAIFLEKKANLFGIFDQDKMSDLKILSAHDKYKAPFFKTNLAFMIT